MSAELSVESDIWNYCECFVFITYQLQYNLLHVSDSFSHPQGEFNHKAKLYVDAGMLSSSRIQPKFVLEITVKY
jgi:hypothetical protein